VEWGFSRNRTNTNYCGHVTKMVTNFNLLAFGKKVC
jgi:hypothetical protein